MAPTHSTPVMAASENGQAGMMAAMALLRSGGRALDAVELACRITEDDPTEHSVGYSGLPNLLGDVELDASIMDGRTLRCGSVAALYGYGNPITLARQVMEKLPHVLLVGRGAERFAAEMGRPPADQRTPAALARWRARFDEAGLTPDPHTALAAVAHALTAPVILRPPANLEVSPEEGAHPEKEDRLGTVNFLARDRYGDIASAVSTSGMAWKYPGRLGDSPIIGAGNYCDNRYGAVACTGRGELAIRAGTARSLILYLKQGMTLEEAGQEALRDLAYVEPLGTPYMNIVAMNAAGETLGFATAAGRYYLAMTADMDEPVLHERQWLAE
jgi:L-asparaginase / beta-aspartyl-peptidase